MKSVITLAPNLSLPLAVAGQAVVILGLRGSGKTNTASVVAEEFLAAQQPIVVIDPTDGWWGLRAGKDGDPAGGYPVLIFGGTHADVPLEESDGKTIAEFLVAETVPAILSLRHLRKAAQRRFVTDFCEELYHLKGRDDNRTPLTVFIDEAPLFVPQKVLGDVARTVGAVEDLVARGRNTGFGVFLISQRAATLNADVRTQADTIFCHRVTAKLDRDAIKGWFEENASTDDLKGILQSLASLKNGEAWVWAPSLDIMQRTQLRRRKTFDSSATPELGKAVRAPKRLADIDINRLKEKMAAVVERAKADDPKELRRQIAELEDRVGTGMGALTDSDIAQAEAAGYERGKNDAHAEMTHLILSAWGTFERETSNAIRNFRQQIDITSLSDRPAPPMAEPEPRPVWPVRPPEQKPRPAERQPVNGVKSSLPPGELAILTAIAQTSGGATSKALTVTTGYKKSSRDTYLQRLRTKGFIEGDATRWTATTSGIKALGPSYTPLPTGRALREYWLKRLPEGEMKILAYLFECGGAATRDDLSRQTGYKKSSRDTYIQRLRSRALIQVNGDGRINAAQELFGGGRR